MDKTQRFWDRHAAGYSRSQISDEASYEYKLERTRAYLGPDKDILELGCGTGSTATLHAPLVRHIQAVDVSPKMLDIARGKAEAAGIENITFDQGEIDTYPAPEGAFDVVLMLSVLHLMEDRDATLARVVPMLKPGGHLITSTVCLGDTMKFFKLLAAPGKALGLLPTLRVFTTDELRASMTKAGLSIEEDWQPKRGKALFLIASKPPQQV